MTLTHSNIIFLNGTSSSGKTSIATCLQQQLLPEPFLHFPLDSFIAMMPVVTNEFFITMVDGYHRSMAAMASAGNHLIIDHVLIDDAWMLQCLELLTPYRVLFVGLDCPLDELERRERQRDARRQGFARSQYDRIHQHKQYDLSIDTARYSPDECTQQILDYMQQHSPKAFATMSASRLAGS